METCGHTHLDWYGKKKKRKTHIWICESLEGIVLTGLQTLNQL